MRALAVVIMFVAALTVLGPLGTLRMPPLRRFEYWLSCAAVAFPVCWCAGAFLLYLTRSRSLAAIVPTLAAAVLFEALLGTAIMATFDRVYRPAYPTAAARWIDTYLAATSVMALSSLFVFYDVLLRTWSKAVAERSPDARPVTSTAGGVQDAQAPEHAAAVDAGRVPGARADDDGLTLRQARFLHRLSRTVSLDVIYLQAVDHYVDVHTSKGSCLVLKRFQDAVADLGGLGMQVHRSYWVAYRHVEAMEQHAGRPALRLTGGLHVPISRPYRRAVRDTLTGRHTEHAA